MIRANNIALEYNSQEKPSYYSRASRISSIFKVSAKSRKADFCTPVPSKHIPDVWHTYCPTHVCKLWHHVPVHHFFSQNLEKKNIYLYHMVYNGQVFQVITSRISVFSVPIFTQSLFDLCLLAVGLQLALACIHSFWGPVAKQPPTNRHCLRLQCLLWELH